MFTYVLREHTACIYRVEQEVKHANELHHIPEEDAVQSLSWEPGISWDNNTFSTWPSSTQKMVALCSPETLVSIYRATLRHIPEDGSINLQCH